MAAIEQSNAKGQSLNMRVEGMDCAACAIKIENALKRLPGVSDINVNYGAESLVLNHDTDRTSRQVIEDKIRDLGYTPLPASAEDATPTRFAEQEDRPWWETRKGRLVFVSAGLLSVAFGVAWVAPSLSFYAYLAAAVVGLVPITRRAIAGALSGTPFSIETLMSVAAVGAIAIGAAEEAAVVIFLFAVGELLENIAAGRARAGIKALIGLVPRVAQIEQVRVGDVALVRPGDRVPSDGEIIEGVSEVDEAPVTGESVPVSKTVGASVYAGSINGNGTLRISITKTAADNTIARIIHLVEDAQASKAPTARFIDKFAAYYTPASMAVAALIIVVPPLFFGSDWQTWIYRGLATLLIACPCALVISTPAAIASGLAAGARRGLLVKGGAALETLGKITAVAFDKTGTLTVGKPQVTDVVAIGSDEDEVLANAAAVEQGSSHPLGLAIIATARARGLAIPQIFGGASAVPGKAVVARLRDEFVSVGSPRHAAELELLPDAIADQVQRLESEGKTVVVVATKDRVLGLIALRDEPRPDAAAGIDQLRALGLRTIMLTGDNRRTGQAIASVLGLDVRAELLPQAKLDAIADLKAHGPVAMVGDGINDAPALAASSVGIAMGGGTDVALETADAALLSNRVGGVGELVGLARATLSNIWQNIALALGLKAVFLVTTLLGISSLWMAILADTGATVLVTANALRLLRFQPATAASSGERA
ncbi:heavy metal translocating P-type ATPase [uncultured Hyphomicrobium sp.]|uniref:heavy metal translocating P-type ATPase n=1 Tax=uncultured Hyphomicrobium sp. TaxID=194373 RepID=UPI0025F632D9|nr:heavy metal translocating P-type ATPase [uncultured Hyphomicrobium sp.]